DPALPLQPVEGRVERPLVDLEHVLGELLNALGDPPAVHRRRTEGFQDQDIEGPLQQIGSGHRISFRSSTGVLPRSCRVSRGVTDGLREGFTALGSRQNRRTDEEEARMIHRRIRGSGRVLLVSTALAGVWAAGVSPAATNKPQLHGRKWVAITGKPLAATAGAMIFQKGGNAVDAAAAMIAAACRMWDTLSWGGETQALIFNPHTGKVVGINALGVAPTGATPEFFKSKGMVYPPEYGPLAAVTPGTPGGIMVMLAEYGKLSLADVL